MVQLTFDGLFRTTTKGLPDTSNLDPYTYLSMNHFVYSLIIQIVIGLVLTGYTGMAVYRAFYKIRNERFFPSSTPDGQQAQQNQQQQQQKSTIFSSNKSQNPQPEQNTNDNLIYRFDEDDNQKEKEEDGGKEGEDEGEDKEEEDQLQQQEETVSEQTTEWFLDLDHKLLFLQPFLIAFVVVVNVFATNVVGVILLGMMLVFFYLFNVKMYCSKNAVFQVFFAVPCVVAFLMVFFEDRDMST